MLSQRARGELFGDLEKSELCVKTGGVHECLRFCRGMLLTRALEGAELQE